jgi:hypothetical protein
MTTTRLATIVRRASSAAVLAFSVLLLANCSAPKRVAGSGGYYSNFDPPAKRPSNPNAVSVKISTGAQRVYVMEGNKVLLATPCSVGTASDPTPKGNFRIYSKQANRRRQSEPDRGYPMAYWMEFKSAYGMHWGFVKPYPCTHGCVRLPMAAAAKIFAMVPQGAALNISSSQAEDATVGRTLPVVDDGPLPNPPRNYLMSQKFFDDAKYKGRLYVD